MTGGRTSAMQSRGVWRLALLLTTLAPACAIDAAPSGARATPDGSGPAIVFDTARRPLPEIPQPNDIATFADPTSRTGRRVNVSLIAPTRLESVAREGFASLEGWGTFAPVTVAFASPLDLEEVARRTTGDYDPSDDPFYIVDLTTGVPVILDMGKGNFPLALADRTKYWANDQRANNLVLLQDLCELMVDGSLCAMGGLTPFPVLSALEHFPQDFSR